MHLGELKSGDILNYKNGQSPLSKAIRWGTGSLYSHTIMYVGRTPEVISRLLKIKKKTSFENKRKINEIIKSIKGSRHVFIESDFTFKNLFNGKNGVHFITEKTLKERSGDHDVFRSKHRFTNIINVSIYTLLRGYKYDFLGLFWQAVVAGKKKIIDRPQKISLHIVDKMYCSELERTIHQRCTDENIDGLLPSQTTPEIEAKRSDVKLLGELVL